MEESNNLELKEKILSYLELPEKIERLKLKKQLFSKEFYATRSMTGTMPIGILECLDYTRPVVPEFGAIVIVDSEATLQHRVDRATKKLALFNELMPFLEVDRLLMDQSLYHVTALEYQVLEAINEVEYYLEEQAKAKQRKEAVTLPENNELSNERKELMQKLEAWGL